MMEKEFNGNFIKNQRKKQKMNADWIFNAFAAFRRELKWFSREKPIGIAGKLSGTKGQQRDHKIRQDAGKCARAPD